MMMFDQWHNDILVAYCITLWCKHKDLKSWMHALNENIHKTCPSRHPMEIDHAIFLRSHVPMEIFFWWEGSGKYENTRRQGTDQENSKETRRKEWRKEKEEIFYIRGGSHTPPVFSIGWERPQPTSGEPLVWPSFRRTSHSYGNLP